MGPDTPQPLTTHAARRRRVLAAVLAGAAVAVPGVAFAAGDASPGTSSAQPAATPPAISVQDEDAAPQERDELCPEEQGESSSRGASAQETAL